MKLKQFVTITIALALTLPALATRPKYGPGYTPGIGDGAGNTTGAGTTEISMPVGVAVDGATNTTANLSAEKSESNIIYTVDLGNETGAASANQTHSALEKARSMNAACVLIRINSFAGGWDDAENIRQEIQGFDKPVMIVVNDNAVSAAAFVSNGSDSVFKSGRSTVITNKKATAIHSKSKKSINGTITGQVAEKNDLTPSAHEDEEIAPGDITMHEVLYKAGLSNLTVVHHAPGISERIAHFLVQPWMAGILLFFAGLVFRYVSRKKLPGPALYLLVIVSALCIAPFHYAGLMNNAELTGSIISIPMVIAGLKMRNQWILLSGFGGLVLFLSLSRINVSSGISDTLISTHFLITAGFCTILLVSGLLSHHVFGKMNKSVVSA
jgi:membrane-bound ClpP family serine protease